MSPVSYTVRNIGIFLDSGIISRMENNEYTFCSLWTEHIKLRNCADLLINEKFRGDYFYNRLCNLANCKNMEPAIIDESRRLLLEKGLNCYVYVQHFDKELENILLKKGFSLLDTMEVLISSNFNKITEYNNPKIHVTKIDLNSISTWIDVFCRSFKVPDWRSEVERTIKTYFKEMTLLVSYLETNDERIPGGCVALFNNNNLMGVYCLGTVSSFRGKGLAKIMIKTSLSIARAQGLDSLFLQTFDKDGLSGFYKKLGFDVIYEKRIYA